MKLSAVIPRPLESEVTKGIVTLLRGCGGIVYETPQGYKITSRSHTRTAGMPDVLAFFPRKERLLFFEVKAQGNGRTPAQIRFGEHTLGIPGVSYAWGGVEVAKALMSAWGLLR